MLKRTLPILLALAVLLTACGAPAAPTMAPADVQNTAVAAAWTMVAATNIANPSATPLPPTEVPSPTALPTFTAEPLLIPTLEVPSTPTTAASTGNCSGPINMGEAGPMKRVRIENNIKDKITVSLNLYAPNLFSQCGVLAVTVAKNGSVIVEIPSGSWYAGAYTPNPPMPNGVSFYLGPSKTTDLLRLIVTKDKINFVGP